MSVEVRTTKPIIDRHSGQTVVETNIIGTVNGFEIDGGINNFVPSNGVKSFSLDRRLKFDIQFDNGNFFLIPNEDFVFVTPWGLVKSLMEEKQVTLISDPTPNKCFSPDIVEPHAISFQTEDNIKIILLSDRVSGSIDVQIEVPEP